MAEGTTAEVMALLLAAAERARALGGVAVTTVGDGIDDAVSALVARRVARATTGTVPVSAADVVDALQGPSGGLVQRLGTAGAGRVARRVARARAVAARTPTGLALRYGPAVAGRLQADLRSVDAAAGFVVCRSRAAKIEPDLVRVERVVVQALAGVHLDPDEPAPHNALVSRWLKDLGRTLSPVPGGTDRSRRAAAVVGALAELDVTRLR